MSQSETSRRTRPSIDDVAAAAGVSKGAVSKVIRNAYGVSPHMRTRVESAIQELGYRPRLAARVMRGASFTMGFEIPQLGNDFFTQVAQGVADELAGTGYQLIIAPGLGEMKGAPVLHALVDRQVDGIIAISPEVTPDWLEELGLEVPVVLLGRHDDSSNYDTLTNDDRLGTSMVMAHLLALGHRAIAHLTVIGSPPVDPRLLPHTIRREGYELAMRNAGLRPEVLSSGPSEREAYEVARARLGGPARPSALFAANDTLAIGALRARAELGLSAREVSIAGYDDIDLSSNPIVDLTTVDQFGNESGRIAVRLLFERITDGRTAARHHVIEPVLRSRGSTQPT